ncbi:putative RNA-directed DNA polymerase [Helianthus annuus]|nr:putative RNA-directed DNA polymerase [Helianthus annuus]
MGDRPKTDDLNPSHTSEIKTNSLHPAYSVTNIQTKIRILDGTKVTYTSWVKLFKLHTMAYKVLDHIDDTPAPETADPQYSSWKELDALVSQWIYSTISDDLLTRVLDTDATARTTWLKLEKIFLSNKQAKATALESRFVNLTLEQCNSVDDYCQHFIWVYPLKYKSETFPTFVKFHNLITTQFQRKIKTFQCDLGGEFDNTAFKTFATQQGLLFRFSCPQTSSQNGRAERMIRRLNDIIHALLIHSHLPPTFWVEALHTATYLHNILPTKRLNFFTPTFALYLRHPTYDHLRVFGCACYPNHSATQPHKLHSRSVRCIFLGYPPDFRGYRCFYPTNGKVHISRHVTFDEHTFPYTIPTTPNAYTFLDDTTPPGFSFTRPPQSMPLSTPAAPNTGPSSHSVIPFPLTYSRRPRPPPTAPPLSAQTQPNSTAPPSHTHTSAQSNEPPSSATAQPTTNTHPMTTRSKAKILHTSTLISPVPNTYAKAFADPHWLHAMQTEFSALQENETWDLVPRPHDHPVIRCMWLFRHKFKSDGSLE